MESLVVIARRRAVDRGVPLKSEGYAATHVLASHSNECLALLSPPLFQVPWPLSLHQGVTSSLLVFGVETPLSG